MESIAQIVPSLQLKPQLVRAREISPIKQRLIEPPKEVGRLHQHTVFTSCFLPVSDPVLRRDWDATDGHAHLRIEAGSALNPVTNEFCDYGLPFGTKARLILLDFSHSVTLRRSPVITLDRRNITYYVRRLGLPTNGPTIRAVAEQLMRVCTSSYHLAVRESPRRVRDYAPQRIVSIFEPSAGADGSLILPECITLADWYYASLEYHAVPLAGDHIRRLQNSALKLDIYVWLAQRLHRIAVGKPQRVSWAALYGQFGRGYATIKKFRQNFLVALREVQIVYKCRIDVPAPSPARRQIVEGSEIWNSEPADDIILYHSAPPIPKRLH